MRFLCFLFLLAFGGAVAAFAYENQPEMTLRFLEDVVQSCVETGLHRTIHLQGDAESARMALSHLAFVFTGTAVVRIRVSPVPQVLIRGNNGGHVLVNYRLAPWERDDWIEYLLA